MGYHHLAMAAEDMQAIHHFYEDIMGFELVKVEVAPIPEGGWGKHFFYRINGDDSRFIAFWELCDVPGQENHIYDLNAGANTPGATFHFAFSVDSVGELEAWRRKWNAAGLEVLEIDHNWCHSVYTKDPNGNTVEFCLTTGTFAAEDRAHALAMMDETEFKPSPPPAKIELYQAQGST